MWCSVVRWAVPTLHRLVMPSLSWSSGPKRTWTWLQDPSEHQKLWYSLTSQKTWIINPETVKLYEFQKTEFNILIHKWCYMAYNCQLLSSNTNAVRTPEIYLHKTVFCTAVFINGMYFIYWLTTLTCVATKLSMQQAAQMSRSCMLRMITFNIHCSKLVTS